MQDFIREFEKVANEFSISGKVLGIVPMGGGHINRTFKVVTSKKQYVMQRINTDIFPDPARLMENIYAVTAYLESLGRETLHVVLTKDGQKYKEIDGGYWRVYDLIANASALEIAGKTAFRHAGVAFGNFQNDLAGFDASLLFEIIPHFHDTPERYLKFIDAVEKDSVVRKKECREEIDFIIKRKDNFSLIMDGLNRGKIPLRVVHNDTKLNNVMIDNETGEARAVVDLDTVMPGSLLFDFGDGIRYGASTAAEDEPDLSIVHFSIGLFTAFAEGFVGAVRQSITPEEASLLPYSAYLMMMECGMRFLTDYLSGDTYFSIKYPEHNLVRARTQLKLASEVETQLDALQKIVNEILGYETNSIFL